ncbi:hypothetical protein ACF07B_15470 [Streptomyces sp. NPDC015532]|uniref:hypothetical protein n=1 Tax=Streptomyces sp. NPDC015532 TaxID=3364960 RepID=UPI003702B306
MAGVKGMKQPRRNPIQRGETTTKLPSFCDLPTPPIPPGANFTAEQTRRWEELWSTPSAWLWSESEIGLVAAYVHLERTLFDGSGTAATIREVKALGESLGMTPQSRARMGYVIEESA